ncbi:MAG: HAD hydrolase-like protein [Bacteroidales bacterium]|nr:HAD hydrolase-like protein [Bacteroidales bacterium]
MKKYRYILMDLDGTIIDPMIGITKSVAYALAHLGIKVDDLKTLCPFIGPPLKDSFEEFYHLTPEQTALALEKYRERFAKKGIFECYVYEGMAEFLERADKEGRILILATSKPAVFAEQILEHFNLRSRFAFVGGSGLDGSRSTKAEVIRHVLNENKVRNLSDVVMIGDRKHDIIGAKETGIDSIGILYGYGDYPELMSAGADYIIPDIAGLSKALQL